MLGAIIGDIVGSRFEWDDHKSKDFDLFGNDGLRRTHCEYTDDSVMTVAVADALLHFDRIDDETAFKATLVERMHYFGQARPNCGFGGRFYRWIMNGDTLPYGSYGNGSAMRVSPVGWYAETLSDAERIAKLTAEVTHNHPEGIRGAQAVAGAIWLARHGKSKAELRHYIAANHYPNAFVLPLRDIRPDYEFDESCQGTVPEALVAFMEGKDFEDAIRNAISLGGDSDTLADITGAVAEAFYGIPDGIRDTALTFLDDELKEVTLRFTEKYCR